MLGGAGFLPSTVCRLGAVGSILVGFFNFAAIAVDAGTHHPTISNTSSKKTASW